MPSRRELANAIRVLSMDAVQQANSGHPGAPMGMADIAEVLWNDFLRHNPTNPQWPNRDRFVLSNGHGSMLLYALLHLSGYALPMEELRNFRQWHSMTPGHPEYGDTPGVETTTGPLGQGLATAVGMAIAERTLGAHYNRPEFPVVNHHTYVFLGDGCLMEGISHEACSLAGTLGLGKLIGFYDDNNISIDGEVGGWFSDDTPGRFRAYGWQVLGPLDGHDPQAIHDAVQQAQANTTQPSLIICKTVIGQGSPNKAGTAKTHGSPLGADEIAATREALGWHAPPFEIPELIRQGWDAQQAGAEREQQWQRLFDAYRQAHPELAAELHRRLQGELPTDWSAHAEGYRDQCADTGATVATRVASQQALNHYGPILPELLGGSADLTGSNNTNWKGSMVIDGERADGNYLHYGVREFAMMAMMNGMALHGGFIPYGGTFLIFSDYARNAIRLAALMGQRVIGVLTHDSIGLGEDGPTHQPVEQLWSLRLIPNVSLWRPCDAVETAVAWQAAIERSNGPTLLALSRQGLAHQIRTKNQLRDISRGGYILGDCPGEPEAIVIATGSEVALAMAAAAQLAEQERRIRVVSMPAVDVFEAQEASYREQVLPNHVPVVVVEAGSSAPWYRYAGRDGVVIGLDRFGASAPAKVLFEELGFSVERVVAALQQVLS